MNNLIRHLRTTTSNIYILIACLSIGLVGLISCLLDSNVAASTTSIGTGKITVRNQNAISIEVTGNQGNGSNVVKLKPALGGAVETGTATIKVSTNLPGYNLVIKDADEETALVSSKDDMYTIPAGIPEQGTSAWGYKVDDAEGWNTISTNSTLVKNRNTVPPEGGDVTLVTFGVSINSKQMEGNYLDEVLFIVVANDGPSIPPTPEEEPTLSNLAYMQDMTPEICSRSAEHETKQLIDKRDGKRYWVAKLKDGQCWMVQNLALDLSTSKKLTPGDTDVTSDWTPTHNTETVVPAKGTMTDYEQVARSWNLGNYVYTTPTDGTLCNQAVGTDDLYDNVMTGGTLANLSCDGRYKPYASGDDAHYSVGNYYTYSAATAKTGDSLTGDTDGSSIASGSICPKGWTLPKSGMNGNLLSNDNQFYQLLHAYGYPVNTATGTGAAGTNTWNLNNRNPYTEIANTTGTQLELAPMYFNRSGIVYINNGSFRLGSYYGFYWASSAFDASAAFFFDFNRNVSPADHASRAHGLSIRCLAR